MKFSHTIFIILIISNISIAQNLVNNPDFETYSSCPVGQQLLSNATGWSKPPVGITIGDYYNACNTSFASFACDSIGVPYNFGGFTPAHSGNAYVGFLAYYGSVREYISGGLSSPLVAGKEYELSFYVRIAPHAKYAVDKIGMYLSNGVISQTFNYALTAYTPQLESSTMLTDYNNWTLIKGTYIAVGGEQYITIGNFHDNSGTNYITTGTAAGGCSLANNGGYYYIDDVSVIPVELLKAFGDTIICQGDSALIGATGAAMYSWTISGSSTVFSTDSQFYVSPSQTTSYVVNGSDTVIVQVVSSQAVDLGNDTSFCSGQNLVLDAGISGATYLWSTGEKTQSITVSATGTYSVSVSSGNCVNSDQIDITELPNPIVNLGSDQAICQGQIFTLDAGNTGASYLWSTGDVTQTISVSIGGSYYVDVSQNGCTGSDTITLIVNPAPVVNLGADTGLCKGGSIVLDAGNSGANYLWANNGSTSQTITVKDTMLVSGGYFSVKVNQGSCVDEDTIKVVFYDKPVVSMNDTAYCENELLILDATYTGATSYLWNTGATDSAISIITQGQYTVSINNNGCIGYDTVNTFMIPVAKINLGTDTIICEGNTLTLDVGNSGTTYNWSTGETSISIILSSAGTYWIKVYNSYCSSSDTIQVNYQAYPVAGLGNDQHFCIGNTVTLSTDYTGAMYNWSTGEKTQSISVDSTGDYWLIVDMNHCRDTDTVHVRRDPLPAFDLGQEQSICPEEEIEITTNVIAQAYYWNTGEHSASIIVSEAGLYTVTVIDSNSCMYTDSVIFNDHCPTVLYVPSTFTPNGDQKNDIFTAKGTNVYSFSMSIFDRWGKEIFITNNLEKGWDGTINGKEAPEEVYSWKIFYSGEREDNLEVEQEKMGIIALIR